MTNDEKKPPDDDKDDRRMKHGLRESLFKVLCAVLFLGSKGTGAKCSQL